MSLNITNGNTVSLLRKSIAGTLNNDQMDTLKYSSKQPSLGKKFNKINYQMDYEIIDNVDNIITKGRYVPQPKLDHKNHMHIVNDAKKREEQKQQQEEDKYNDSESDDSDSDDEKINIDININNEKNTTLIIVLFTFIMLITYLIYKSNNKSISGSNEKLYDESENGKKIITYEYEVESGNTNIMGHKPLKYNIS